MSICRKPKCAVPLDDEELLGLGVVVVLAARDAGAGREVAELAGVGRLEHLHKHAARVGVWRGTW